MRHKHSDYMHWSKTQSRARFNLATSGVAPFPLRDLPINLDELEINGDNSYGYAPLQQAIAAHYGVDPDCVAESALREIGDIASSVGALVLVDEVYLDAVYENKPRTSFHLGQEFVVTSSLTKVYGVSGLRCGWILAQPDLAWKMRRLNDLYAATAVYPGELLSVAAFKHLNLLRERARRVLEADRKLLRDFLKQQSSIFAVWTEWGTTSFVRLSRDRGSNVNVFLERLRSKFDTSAVPGRFFEMPDHFRIGMGVDTEMFAEGLSLIGQALR